VTEALSKARWSFDSPENAADLDASPGAGTYPMTAVVYAVIPNASANAKKTAAYLLDAVQRGDGAVSASGFIPLPPSVKTTLASK
jgi:ABC-type phosphate transport system substrate-binding protein